MLVHQIVSAATVDAYHSCWMSEARITSDVAHYKVGICCISRIVQGLTSVPCNLLTDANKLHRLWIHEVCRAWGDRLTSHQDRRHFLTLLDRVSMDHFKQSIDQYLSVTSAGKADYSMLPKIHFSQLQSFNATEVICDEVILLLPMLTAWLG